MSPQPDDTTTGGDHHHHHQYDSTSFDCSATPSTDDTIVGPSAAQLESEQRQRRMMDELERSQRQWDQGQHYDWKLHFPSKCQQNPIKLLKWVRAGFVLGAPR